MARVIFRDKVALEILDDGKEIKYRYHKGFYFHQQTPQQVIEVLADAFALKYRIRLYLGHTSGEEAGLDWLKENDVQGYVGRSTGQLQVPLLKRSQNDLGGDSILDHCIVKITKKDRILYKHTQYRKPEMVVQTDSTSKHNVLTSDGKILASFGNRRELSKWLKKVS